MKDFVTQRKHIIFASLGILIFLSFGCNPIKKMQKNLDLVKVKVADETLEVHADSIEVMFKTYIPEKFFHKRAILKLEPILIYNQDSLFLDPFFVAGEKVDLEINQINPDHTVAYKEGGTVEYSTIVPYKEGMKNSIIYILTSYKIDSEYDELDVCICDVKKDKLSEGVITTSQSVQPTDNIEIAGSVVGEKIVANGTIYYKINSSRLSKGQTASKDFELPFVIEPIKDLAIKNGMKIENLKMHSQASPDGKMKLNEKLAKNRKKSSLTYIKYALEEIGFDAVYDSSFYSPDETTEDWKGLKDLISKSDIENKSDIVKIINSDLALDVKEENIKKLTGEKWDYLASDILPKLRKTEISLVAKTLIREIDSLQKLYDNGQLASLYNKQELLLLAFNQEDFDKQMELFELYKKNNPDEYVGDNNIAGIHLMKGKAQTSLEILEPLAEKYPNKKEIISNIGLCYRYLGRYDTAMTLYEQAESMSVDERNNKAILNIKTADYDLAVSTFEENRYDYNRALAFTLNKDFEGAKNVIDKIEDKTAIDFYLRAIVGARSKDIDLLTTSLTRAIKLDSSLREKAKGDYEFKKYWTKPEFENAIR
ncbi:MAG: hypothetical protein U9R42_09650 [Bacteroidota bacterium]|nr:hypothetical protein [Bacteroidota bacterium]